ncbi:2-hydroxyacid dehydrogenase [Ureibacillus acetophenoni]|uniref:Glyoxylate reductase n=1 Tax=Ureibacillus acetophenoni TaxID=614649 RepID=A0A285USQ4_9BACL|nr:D-glycerate dehydrogenase [Ureibacillus acetophenoni]SOC44428.1 glyoxylate reductase [Ureibacillus acetophenoni]
MKPSVLITRKLSDSILNRIRESCEVIVWENEDTPIPRKLLESKIPEVDGLLCLITESIDKELLDKAKNLKIISNMAVGYNNIDVEAATDKGIMVTNTPDVLTETTADLTFALLMATARRLVEASDYLRDGKWQTWSPMLLTGQDVYGATIGIIGMGRIGEAVAKRAKGFNMNILYHNRNRKSDVEQELEAHFVDFNTLLQQSDFVVVMTPYSAETRNLITAEHFKLMKKNAILINSARGGIVNENDLYEALVNNEIWAAGLDVFEEEPVPTDHPLLTLNNVVTLPHIGSASYNTRMKMADLAATNLLMGVNGEKPLNLVNSSVREKY